MNVRHIVLLLFVSVACPAMAWNDFGHMAVAAIAYPHLTPGARQRVDQLLQRNPEYAEWIRDPTTSDREQTAFMRAATWADAIKGKPDYTERPERGITAIRPGSGYRDKLQHRAWHYINTPFSLDGTPGQVAKTPNVQTQIAALRRALQARGDLDTQSYSLVWLLHLVGDAHQPLHASTRFGREFPLGDHGGNAVVVCAKTCDQDLHAYWDRVLGNSRKPDVVLRAVARYAAVDTQRAANIDETVWLAESAEIARRIAYAPPVPLTAESVTLSKHYKSAARSSAEQQAVLAGLRLANLLNQIFQ